MLAAAGGSTALEVVAMVLMGCGAILAVSLVFLAIGRSEDRERAQARAPQPPAAGPGPEPRRTVTPPPRPPRRRDHE